MKKVAVLGTGKMGGAIARRLKSGGFDISVWDRTRSKAEALHVGSLVDSPAEVARQADVLVTMVTGPQALHDVYFGPTGVFAAGAEATIVDMSTVGPAAARELAHAAELKGAKLVEAPVVGSIPAVNSGTLLILAGAALVEDLESVRPVLQQLGEVHYVGDVGSAAALKLVANSFLGIVSAGAAELMAAGRVQGLDPASRYGVGARSPEQVDGCISAGRLRLDAADLAEIASALERTQAGSGPTRPAAVADGRGSWLEHGLDPSSLEGAIARMVLPANR